MEINNQLYFGPHRLKALLRGLLQAGIARRHSLLADWTPHGEVCKAQHRLPREGRQHVAKIGGHASSARCPNLQASQACIPYLHHLIFSMLQITACLQILQGSKIGSEYIHFSWAKG